MGGLAVLVREAGHKVTGCDAGVYPPMTTQLEAQGIELIEGYGAEQLALEPDLFVIGNVVTRGNPLMEEILNRGLPHVSGPQWLGEHVLNGKWVPWSRTRTARPSPVPCSRGCWKTRV